MDQRRADDDEGRLVVADVLHERGERRQPVAGMSVRTVSPTAVRRSGSAEQEAAALRRRVAQRDEDLLLARLPGEVALAEALAERA